MSLRNRELANLIVVGMLTAIGFASVYIARQAVVSTGSLAYAGFFFALYLAAHLVCRLTVPNADPYLLPMAALLTAVGLTEIYRLDPTDAFRQGLWLVVAVGALAAALLYSGIYLAMLYVATGRLANVLIGGVLFVGGAAGAYTLIGHVRTRVEIWIDPWPHIHTSGYQITQSLYSISNGGFGGAGLGKGTFTTTNGATLIPSANTDFIYSAIAQELGLVGAAALLLVFMLFIARGMKVAMLADDGFSKLLAAGLTFSFALQTFIIVGGILRMIPLTGVTLPFVSYGGSCGLS